MKTTLAGGLFVLLPLVLLYLLLSEMLELVVALATPIAELFPKGLFDEVNAPLLVALLLLIGTAFIFGLALRSAVLRRLGLWIERTLLGRMPLYDAVKRLSRGLVGENAETAFQPAVMTSADGVREIVYVVEAHANGQLTVLLPWAPAAFAGTVKIIGSDRIDMLDASVGEASRVLGQWGMGARDLLSK
jgi:uncharacterized membrane protein